MPGNAQDRSIADAVAEVRIFISGDGGELELVEYDPEARRIRLRIDLSAVECPDCVLPPQMLAEMITAQLRDSFGDFEIAVEDPRELSPPSTTHR